ncbi:protein MAINTENANCE OF MERISTEMS-like [Papaver somniferum]|uniref:protein MAINTENANCE OF MERISTEMS-like n=1 Tax=Papaver somniferum TaxID=3469 RepID=UPI000E6F71DB|nr:protein MAINTENANCE OF MERISTEMS-like [Papaver somniferum]
MGLIPAVENLDLGYDKPLCSSLAERYYGEIDTFHLPFGEMTITPNDTKFITELSIEGKSVKHANYMQELERDKIYVFTKDVFQWDEERTKSEMLVGKSKQMIFHLSRLRDNFMGTKKLRAEGNVLTRERIIATDNAYVLYVLGCVIFPDVSGARVSANFIQPLQPFDKIHEYSWGTAILAHSLNELIKASRARRNQIGGDMAFLHALIYVHFPIFAQRAFENKEWDHKYYGDKYIYKSKPKNQNKGYLKLRRQLDNLTAKNVVFDPYKEELAKGKGKGKKPLPSCDYWEDRAFHRYPLDGPSRTDDDSIPGYMTWYPNVSHTRVIRVDERPKIEDKALFVECLLFKMETEKPSRVLDNPSKAINQGREKC